MIAEETNEKKERQYETCLMVSAAYLYLSDGKRANARRSD